MTPMGLSISWRNIWRNPRRTILTVTAIAFAGLILVFMLSFQFGSYEMMIDASVKTVSGHLKITEKAYPEDHDMRLVVPDPGAISRKLDTLPHVRHHTLRSNAFSLVSSRERTYGIMVMGIDPKAEARISPLKSTIREGDYLGDDQPYGALVGEHLARNLKVGVGDEVTLIGQGRDGSVAAAVVTISGIFSSGFDEYDRNVLMMRRTDFNDIFFMGDSVHEIVIIADSLYSVAEVKARIIRMLKEITGDDSLIVQDWMEMQPGLLQSIKMDLSSGIIMYVILIIVVAFSIFNTFLMAILERTREFGVMMALGVTPGRLTRLVLLESACMTGMGVLAGIVLGSLITLYFQHHGIYIGGMEEMMRQYGLPDRLYPRLSVVSAMSGPVLVFVITLLSAVVPALKIRRLNPVEAMTHV